MMGPDHSELQQKDFKLSTAFKKHSLKSSHRLGKSLLAYCRCRVEIKIFYLGKQPHFLTNSNCYPCMCLGFGTQNIMEQLKIFYL